MVWLFFVWIIIQTGVVFPANVGDIIITEFFYEKSSGNFAEYIELFNNTDSLIEILGWKVHVGDHVFEIDGACDDGVATLDEVYTDESACTDAGYVWKPFSINSNDYAVILSSNGKLVRENTIYCSPSYADYSNFCNSPILFLAADVLGNGPKYFPFLFVLPR